MSIVETKCKHKFFTEGFYTPPVNEEYKVRCYDCKEYFKIRIIVEAIL